MAFNLTASEEDPSGRSYATGATCQRRLALPFLLWAASAGCLVTQEMPGQSEVLKMQAPDACGNYLLYVPSTYKDAHRWPLVVVCHGTRPWDSANMEMREWARFAEDRGILVAAPTLQGTAAAPLPPPERQIALQQRDERLILGMVAAIKRAYNVAEERVFMTGWSAGSFAILYTGLKNPDVFRALFVRQGSFDERCMAVPAERLDRWQPIKVMGASADIIRDQTRACIKWLRDRELFVESDERPGIHRRLDPQVAWDFFEKVVEERPWIRLRTHPVRPDRPLALRFALDAIPAAKKQKWFLGDGGESYDREPVHEYAKPGEYTVWCNVELAGGQVYRRSRVIRVGTGE